MKKDALPLSRLEVGQRGIVKELVDEGRNITLRLKDLGLNEGAAVECVMVSPFGDPSAYIIKGSVIALRREDARTVKLIRDSVTEAERHGAVLGGKRRAVTK